MARRQFKWFIITIPTIYLIIGAIAILLLAGGLLGLVFGTQYLSERHQNLAMQALEEAEILLEQADEAKIPPFQLSPARTLQTQALAALDARDYKTARDDAEECVHQLKYLIASYKPEVEGVEGRFARVTEIHGVVEVLPPGSADWITASLSQILRSGTRVRTRAASTAKLRFDDGSTIHLKAESLIMIRDLTEDEQTLAKQSRIELGQSEIEALIPEPDAVGSSFNITMPDKSEARIESEANVSLKVDETNRSVVKVFMGRVDIHSGDLNVALTTREAIVLDANELKKKNRLEKVAIPLPPRLIYPSNVQLIPVSDPAKDMLYFRWTSVKDTPQYLLEISKDYYFYDRIVKDTFDDNKAKINTLESGNYYWRVSTMSPAGVSSEPSPFNSFRIVEATELEAQKKDLKPPNVTIDRVTILGRIVDISGRTETNTSLFVNERKEDVREDGSFRVLVEFSKPGPQTVFIEAYDSSGNVTTVRRDVNISESAVR